jgi:dihydrofolate reductase
MLGCSRDCISMEANMSELVCELIVSLDGFAKGQRSPGYYGYFGPDFDNWIQTNSAIPHRMIIGRKTYEMMNGFPAQFRDKRWRQRRAGYSRKR